MKYLNEYNNIMRRYRNGEFGDDNLSMYEILNKANSPGLLDKLDLTEIQCLMDSSSGITKQMFSMLKQQKENKINVMKSLEKELGEYNIDFYRDEKDVSDDALAGNLKLIVLYCDDNELEEDTEALLCPIEDQNYLGKIKVKKDCVTTRFSFRHELIHYFRDVKVGNRVTKAVARKIRGKTPNDEEQDVNYLTAASIMPIEEIGAELAKFEEIVSHEAEEVFLLDLAKKYGQNKDAVLRRLIEVRCLIDYEGSIKV